MLIVAGLLWIILTADQQNYFLCLPDLIIFVVGIPLTIPSDISLIMGPVNPLQMEMASGAFITIRQFSLALGVEIFSAIIATFNHWHIPPEALAAQRLFYTHSFVTANIRILLIASIAFIVVKWLPHKNKGAK